VLSTAVNKQQTYFTSIINSGLHLINDQLVASTVYL